MKKIRLVAGALVLGGGVVGLAAYRRADASVPPAYRFATVDRGDVESTVSSTGTLSADTTIQVGTQVSGRVTEILVDYNDHVKTGQLLARIDPTLAQQDVSDAQAGVARAQATLDQTQSDYNQEKAMYDKKVVTLTEFATSRSAYEVAKGALTSAQVALEKAKQELGFCDIYSPIDGIVVDRNVNVGQTVASSFSAPQLFLLANNLNNMQILASVDESDIGFIKPNQPARFTVQAYANRQFTGTVKQVRLQSTTADNVVNYTVVVDVKNPDGALLPGMTATVNFMTGQAKDALTVPNAALRFQPPEGAVPPDSSRRRGPGGRGGALAAGRGGPGGAGGARGPRGPGGAPRAAQASQFGVVWYVANGQLERLPVRVGMTDGQKTAITPLRSDSTMLKQGAHVVVGLALGDAPKAGGSSSPFQQERRGPGRGF